MKKDREMARTVSGQGTIPPAYPVHELTALEAAGFLNVSRSFVVNAIKAGLLKCRMVGARSRTALADFVTYSHQIRERQVAALNLLAANATELKPNCQSGHLLTPY